jgi:hypothetical protein
MFGMISSRKQKLIFETRPTNFNNTRSYLVLST